MRSRRICTLVLCLLVWASAAQAGPASPTSKPQDAEMWLWFMGFDRSPNAVRAQFNDLIAGWDEGDAWEPVAEAMEIGRATLTEDGDGFVFRNRQGEEAFLAPNTRVQMSGTLDGDGAIERFTMVLTPREAFSEAYSYESHLLMEAAMFSLFESAGEKADQLNLLYVYDVCPYTYLPGDVQVRDRERKLVTAIDGVQVGIKTRASARDNRLKLIVQFGRPAGEQQQKAAKRNDAVNELLDQSLKECYALESCLSEINNMFLEDDVQGQFENMRAVIAQMQESLSVLAELKLSGYEKCEAYGLRLEAAARQMEVQLDGLLSAIDQGINWETAAEGPFLELCSLMEEMMNCSALLI